MGVRCTGIRGDRAAAFLRWSAVENIVGKLFQIFQVFTLAVVIDLIKCKTPI